MSSKSIVVTGGFGFIGSAVIKKIQDENIIVVSPFSPDLPWENIKDCKIQDFISPEEFLKIAPEKASSMFSSIIHLGANSSTSQSDVGQALKTNTKYTIDLIERFRGWSFPIVVASSASVYGHDAWDRKEDCIKSLNPLNLYGASKAWIDRLYHSTPGVYLLRYFNVYGPGEWHKSGQSSPFLKFYKELMETKTIKLFKSNSPDIKDGEQSRDFISVRNAAEITLWIAGDRFRPTRNENNIFNVGTGISTTFNDVAKIMSSCCNLPSVIEYIDMPEEISKGYQNRTRADNSKLIRAGFDNWFFLGIEADISDYICKMQKRGI